MTRQQARQRVPDESLDWRLFPQRTLAPGRLLYRAARRSPWWYCSLGDCRFDLPPPRGTCYLGTDPVSGLLECLGPEWAAGYPVTRSFVRARRVHAMRIQTRTPLADLVSRRAVGFRVTNELSDMTPYEIPQEFARLLDSVVRGGRRCFAGIRFRTRFDTGPAARGVALFGDEGLHATPSVAVREVDDALLADLAAVGIVVAEPPLLADLTLARDRE